jgi:hypothetical protein
MSDLSISWRGSHLLGAAMPSAAKGAAPGQPDRGWVDDWLHRSYLNFWARQR